MNLANHSIGRWAAAHAAQLRQGVRMTVGGLVALGLGELLGMPRPYWAVLTAVLVTQTSLGGSIRASIDRLIGTVCGAIWGAAIALTIPHQDVAGAFLATGAAVAPLAFASAISPSFRIAPVTAIIVLLIPSAARLGVVPGAVDRVAEIIFGCLVGLACSLLVLPSRAHQLLSAAAAALARLLADLTQLQLRPPGDAAVAPAIAAKQAQVRAAIARLDQVAAEARQEHRTNLAGAVDPEPLTRTLLRLRHDLVMMGRACGDPLPPGPIAWRLQPKLDDLAEAIVRVLTGSAEALMSHVPAPPTEALSAARQAYGREVDAIRSDRLTRELGGDAVERLFALGFALDQLCRDLEDLAARAGEQAARD